MVFKCPKCNSSLFKVDKYGENYKIKCYRTKKCGWNPNQDIKETLEEKERRVIKALQKDGEVGDVTVADIRELMIKKQTK